MFSSKHFRWYSMQGNGITDIFVAIILIYIGKVFMIREGGGGRGGGKSYIHFCLMLLLPFPFRHWSERYDFSILPLVIRCMTELVSSFLHTRYFVRPSFLSSCTLQGFVFAWYCLFLYKDMLLFASVFVLESNYRKCANIFLCKDETVSVEENASTYCL